MKHLNPAIRRERLLDSYHNPISRMRPVLRTRGPGAPRKRRWGHMYRTKTWKRLREEVLGSDPFCVLCHKAPATDVDHIVPHAGEWDVFTDRANLQPLCKECHKGKSRLEHRAPRVANGLRPFPKATTNQG